MIVLRLILVAVLFSYESYGYQFRVHPRSQIPFRYRNLAMLRNENNLGQMMPNYGFRNEMDENQAPEMNENSMFNNEINRDTNPERPNWGEQMNEMNQYENEMNRENLNGNPDLNNNNMERMAAPPAPSPAEIENMQRNDQEMIEAENANRERVLKLNTNRRIRFIDDIHAYNNRVQPSENSESIITTGQKTQFADETQKYNNRDQSTRPLSMVRNNEQNPQVNLSDSFSKILKFEQMLNWKMISDDPAVVYKANDILKETRAIKLGLIRRMKSQMEMPLAQDQNENKEGMVRLSANNRRINDEKDEKSMELNSGKQQENEINNNSNKEKVVNLAKRRIKGQLTHLVDKKAK